MNMNMNMSFEEIIASAKMAFMTADFKKAIEYAEEARKLDEDNPEPYEIMAKSYQARKDFDNAVKYFEKAKDCDINNGDRYIELGIAYGSNEQLSAALNAFAKAESLECSDEHKSGMYRTLAFIDYDIGRYDDAVANFKKAEEYLEPDLEIIMYKALSYSMAGDISNAVQTAKTLKSIAPTDYNGYKLVYTFYMHFKKFDDAEKELIDAKDIFVSNSKNLPMDFYFDYADLLEAKCEEETDENNKKEYLAKIIGIISNGLETAKPDIDEVVNAYIQSADIYLKLAEYLTDEGNKKICYEFALDILNAANSPAQSFNQGFRTIKTTQKEATPQEPHQFVEACDYDELSLENIINGSMENSYISQTQTEEYKLDTNESIDMTDEVRERIYMLYIGAYTGLKKYKEVLDYVKKIKNRNNSQIAHIGRYLEAKTYADMGEKNTANKLYEELIEYYRKEIIKDPSDLAAVSYRVQCYIDLERYEDARAYSHTLPEAVKQSMLEQINKASNTKII